jgi:hypothetical protein
VLVRARSQFLRVSQQHLLFSSCLILIFATRRFRFASRLARLLKTVTSLSYQSAINPTQTSTADLPLMAKKSSASPATAPTRRPGSSRRAASREASVEPQTKRGPGRPRRVSSTAVEDATREVRRNLVVAGEDQGPYPSLPACPRPQSVQSLCCTRITVKIDDAT